MIQAISSTFLIIYIATLLLSLPILKEEEPSVIQLSVMIGINALFIFALVRAEKGVRELANRRLRKAFVKATEKHTKLSFSMKQQARGKGIFTYIEIIILEPIAAFGGWDEASDGELVLNLEEQLESVWFAIRVYEEYGMVIWTPHPFTRLILNAFLKIVI